MRVPFSMIASYVLRDHSFKCAIYAFGLQWGAYVGSASKRKIYFTL